MKSFDYTVKDELGLHARPAGALSKKAKEYQCDIMLRKGEDEINAKKLFAIMGLGVKKGDKITFSFDGCDEIIACRELKNFCQEAF